MSQKSLSRDARFDCQIAPNSMSAEASPQAPQGELTALPHTIFYYLVGYKWHGKGKERMKWKRKGREKEGREKERERERVY